MAPKQLLIPQSAPNSVEFSFQQPAMRQSKAEMVAVKRVDKQDIKSILEDITQSILPNIENQRYTFHKQQNQSIPFRKLDLSNQLDTVYQSYRFDKTSTSKLDLDTLKKELDEEIQYKRYDRSPLRRLDIDKFYAREQSSYSSSSQEESFRVNLEVPLSPKIIAERYKYQRQEQGKFDTITQI
ncbi:hypothetical protein FGO68_gene2187 [Halteria grandinella]|uniref:Uncharacterized protein n=1 Tax=Halteria grandinella TaxID=5974 RepID=A0A8J8NDT5_HALGN|nr:hypothetical protein FGO68_gene2187 [Halteria grandinella]